MPREWRRALRRIRRFGFHGLSHAYCSRRAAELLGRPLASLRIVTCHLGAGASLAAVLGGRSVDTTMGFTPLEGLVMATRSGTVDPGLVLWLEEHEHLSPARGRRRPGAPLRAARPGRHRRHAPGRGRGRPRRPGRAGWPSTSTSTGCGRHRRDGRRDGRRRRARVHRRRRRELRHGPAGERPSGWPSSASPSTPPATTRTAQRRPRHQRAGTAVRTLVITAREDLQIAREARQLLQG